MGKKNTPNPDAQWDGNPYHAFPFVPVAIFHRYNVDSPYMESASGTVMGLGKNGYLWIQIELIWVSIP